MTSAKAIHTYTLRMRVANAEVVGAYLARSLALMPPSLSLMIDAKSFSFIFILFLKVLQMCSPPTSQNGFCGYGLLLKSTKGEKSVTYSDLWCKIKQFIRIWYVLTAFLEVFQP